MRQILCVIDLTDSSLKVLEVAARIAMACREHLIVLFPYRLIDYGYEGSLAALKLKLETEAKEKFSKLRTSLAATDGLSWEFQPEIGFMADRIKAHVTRENESIDMIIIGQEQTAAANDSKGFNLQHLITNSRLPFVIVPSEVTAVANVH